MVLIEVPRGERKGIVSRIFQILLEYIILIFFNSFHELYWVFN